MRELARLYEAFSQGADSPLEEFEIQYPDFADWQRQVVSPNPRYHRLLERIQLPVRKLVIFGTHFHIGISDPGSMTVIGSLDVENEVSAVVGSAFLAPNVPNPFDSGTRIRFELPQAGPFRLAVYDLHGRLVRELAEGRRSAGVHAVDWDGRGASGLRAASGIYFVHLATPEEARTRKVLLLPE